MIQPRTQAIGAESAFEPLRALALGDPDRFVRCHATEALVGTGGRNAVETLIAALDDEYAPVGVAAALALKSLGDPRAIGPLTSIVTLDSAHLQERWKRAVQAEHAYAAELDPESHAPSVITTFVSLRVVAAGALKDLGVPPELDSFVNEMLQNTTAATQPGPWRAPR